MMPQQFLDDSAREAPNAMQAKQAATNSRLVPSKYPRRKERSDGATLP